MKKNSRIFGIMMFAVMLFMGINQALATPPSACAPAYSTSTMDIWKFNFNNGAIDWEDPSFNSRDYYQDHAATQMADVEAGNTYSMTSSFTRFYSREYGGQFMVHVDWNQDGDFGDTDERVYDFYASGSQARNHVNSITVPAWVTPGEYRIRLGSVYWYYWLYQRYRYQSMYDNGCMTYSYSYYWCQRDFALNVVQPGPDASITAITTPTGSYRQGTYDVNATLANIQNDEMMDMTNVEVHWSVNGMDQPMINWTGLMAAGSSENVLLGQYDFSYQAGGPWDIFQIEVWTANPNNSSDPTPENDRASLNTAPIRDDAGVVAQTAPTVFPEGTEDVWVTVQNFGARDLSNFTVRWELNGVEQTPVDVGGVTVLIGETVSVNLGPFEFLYLRPFAAYDFHAWTEMPNSVDDEDMSNDDYYGNIAPSLTPGTYYVGGVNPHFAQVCDATAYVNMGGIFGSGDIIFSIRRGTYTCQVDMQNVPTGGNDIYFHSQTGNRNDVVVVYAATGDFVWRIDGVDNVHFSNMSFEMGEGGFGPIFNLMGGTSGLTVDNCAFTGMQSGMYGGDPNILVFSSNNDGANNMSFTNNLMNFGYGGFHFEGSGGTTNKDNNQVQSGSGLVISDNVIQGYANIGIFNEDSPNPIITNNSVGGAGGINPPFGIVSNPGGTITGNSISALMGTGYYDPTESAIKVGGPATISDNTILYNADISGIYLEDGSSGSIMNNRIDIGSSAWLNTAGINLNNSNNVLVQRNNIIMTDGYAVLLNGSNAKVYYNDLNSSSGYSDGMAVVQSTNSSGVIAENMCSGENVMGIDLTGSTGMAVYYNSIYVDDMNGSALNIDGGTNTMFRNLLINRGSGPAVNVNLPVFFNSDENNFWTGGTVLGSYDGAPAADIAGWSASSGGDVNSANVEVYYASNTDLHLTQFDDRIYHEDPLPLSSQLNSEVQEYDFDMETREVFYYGVDNLSPSVTLFMQPESVVDCENAIGNQLNVVADVSFGGSPIYQWQIDGVDIPGATDAVLLFDEFTHQMSGVYQCRVWGTGGAPEVITDAVLVYALQAPEVTRQPVTTVVQVDDMFVWDVEAQIYGELPPEYWTSVQWYVGDTPLVDDGRISGAQSSVLSIIDIQQSDYRNDYRVVLTGYCGTAESEMFGIQPQPEVNILSQPMAGAMCEGEGILFNVTADGLGGTLEYQWKFNGTPLVDDGRITGATTNELVITDLTMADEGDYSVEVSITGVDMKESDAAALDVQATTAISGQPAGGDFKVDDAISLLVVADGENLTYMWRKDGVDLGITGSVFIIVNASLTDAGAYTCVVTGDCGDEVESEVAIVTVSTGGGTTGIGLTSKSGFKLYTNTPNPVSSTTLITFDVPGSAFVKLVLTDMQGREVAVLFNATAEKESNEVEVDASALNLTAGVYNYILTSKDVMLVRQMVVRK